MSIGNPGLFSQDAQAQAGYQWYMLQSHAGFFQASRPVLETLQKLEPVRLPFARYLAAKEPVERISLPSNFRGRKLDLSRLVMTKTELEAADNVVKTTQRKEKPPPKRGQQLAQDDAEDEFEEVTTSDLGVPRKAGNPRSRYITGTSLADQERKRLCQRLEQFSVLDLDAEAFPFEEVSRFCQLDQSQLRSLIHLLRSELGLLQGPPGTGKTFVGVQLCLILLDNRDLIGQRPILVPTFTNHALDNFLLDLMQAGVTKLCRIGSQSREPCMERFNLAQLCRTHKLRGALNYRMFELHEKIAKTEEVLAKVQRSLMFTCLSLREVEEVILASETVDNDPDSETDLDVFGSDDDGFEVRGREQQRLRSATIARRNRSKFFTQLKKSCAYGLSEESMWFWWLESFLPPREMSQRANEVVADVKALLSDAREAEKQTKNRFASLTQDDEEHWFFQQTWVRRKDRYVAVQGTEELLDKKGEKVVWPYWDEIKKGKRVPTDKDGDEVLLTDQGRFVPASMHGNRFVESKMNWAQQASKFASGDMFKTWSKQQSLNIYRGWRAAYRQRMLRHLKHAISEFDVAVWELTRVGDEKKRSVLEGCHVVGCTTNAAASNTNVLRALKSQVTILEEAGEVMESHVLATLTSESRQLILIGDHQQLRPGTEDFTLSVDNHRHEYNLDMSLFERLVSQVAMPFETLQTQRRMRPEIADLIRTLYPELQDHATVSDHPNLRGFGDNLVFMDHGEAEDGANAADQVFTANSKSNSFEVSMVVRSVRYLLQQGYDPSQLVVLTPYVGQLMKLRAAFREETWLSVELSEKDEEAAANITGDAGDFAQSGSQAESPTKIAKVQENRMRLRIATIDNYQGEEADVVIVSLVRNSGKVAPADRKAEQLDASFLAQFQNLTFASG
eukprot:489781-Rhodomonas_salina.1